MNNFRTFLQTMGKFKGHHSRTSRMLTFFALAPSTDNHVDAIASGIVSSAASWSHPKNGPPLVGMPWGMLGDCPERSSVDVHPKTGRGGPPSLTIATHKNKGGSRKPRKTDGPDTQYLLTIPSRYKLREH